jgi:hypothetical protein
MLVAPFCLQSVVHGKGPMGVILRLAHTIKETVILVVDSRSVETSHPSTDYQSFQCQIYIKSMLKMLEHPKNQF